MQLKNLKTKFLGRNYIYYNEIDSTQKEIWRIVKKGEAPSGTLVMADIQESAIGTHGRVWHTDEKNNIAFSFFIRMNCDIQKLDGITIEIAETLTDIFKDKYKIDLKIKEPNDIVYNNKKLGGILTETKIMSEKVKYLVIGIGINTGKEEFSDDIKEIATSIKREFGIDVDREYVILEFCNRFEEKLEKRINNM